MSVLSSVSGLGGSTVFTALQTTAHLTIPAGTTGVHFDGVQSQGATKNSGNAGDTNAKCIVTMYRREAGATQFTIWSVSPWQGGGRTKSGSFPSFGQDLDGLDPNSPNPNMTPPAEVYATIDPQGTKINGDLTISAITGT